MAIIRAEVVTQVPGDTPRDFATNTVYHTISGSILTGGVSPDYQNHANELRDLFSGQDATFGAFDLYKFRPLEVKVYDLDDPKPRPVRASANYTTANVTAAANYGPRQVACVLSFHGTRNIVGQRGHVYIGPLSLDEMAPDPLTAGIVDKILALGHGLFNIGGENVAHVVRSLWDHKAKRADPLLTPVAGYWVDNRWDTQRRRLPRPTTRHVLNP